MPPIGTTTTPYDNTYQTAERMCMSVQADLGFDMHLQVDRAGQEGGSTRRGRGGSSQLCAAQLWPHSCGVFVLRTSVERDRIREEDGW